MRKLFIFYVPGLDFRHVSHDVTPTLHAFCKQFPRADLWTYPGPEQLSTVLTGRGPDRHGIWQTRARRNRSVRWHHRLTDRLPDTVTVMAQCAAHQCLHCCDVPTIPPRRRRQLAFHRLKFLGPASTRDIAERIPVDDWLMPAVGLDQFRFSFTDRAADLDHCLAECGTGQVALEILDFHATDVLGHWQHDTEEKVRRHYAWIDDYVRRFQEQCDRHAVTMAFLSDHGQEPVTESIELARELRRIDVPESEYLHYIQPGMARFWFWTERAEVAITQLLRAVPQGETLTYREMQDHGLHFDDNAYGDLYFIPHPGCLIFPHDFYHPAVNLVFGVKNKQQRNRVRNPRQVGYHGYLPHHESEKGRLILIDPDLRVDRPQARLTDIAPTLLALLDRPIPGAMQGSPIAV